MTKGKNKFPLLYFALCEFTMKKNILSGRGLKATINNIYGNIMFKHKKLSHRGNKS